MTLGLAKGDNTTESRRSDKLAIKSTILILVVLSLFLLLRLAYSDQLTRFHSSSCGITGGVKFNGTELMAQDAVHEVDCARICSRHAQCQSINYNTGMGETV